MSGEKSPYTHHFLLGRLARRERHRRSTYFCPLSLAQAIWRNTVTGGPSLLPPGKLEGRPAGATRRTRTDNLVYGSQRVGWPIRNHLGLFCCPASSVVTQAQTFTLIRVSDQARASDRVPHRNSIFKTAALLSNFSITMDFVRIEQSTLIPQSMISTSNDPPAGYEIKETIGIVIGTSVRSRNLFSCICGGLRAICGGSNEFMRTLLVDLQVEACNKMIESAHSKGANAIICVRFVAVDVGIMCTGTAVKIQVR